jgi:hypothetical protein
MSQYPHLTIGAGVHETSRYACVLTEDVGRYTSISGKSLRFYAGDQLIARLYPDGYLVMMAGYACDGYSPTVRWFGKWRRLTPVPKKAGYFPAIRHDLTRQFVPVQGCPWNRQDSDHWFYDDLVAGGESKSIAGAYYSAVSRTLGNAWSKLTYKPDLTLRIVEA